MDIYHLALIYNSPNLNGKNVLLFCQHQLKPYLLVLTLNSAARRPEGLRLADPRSGSGVGADWVCGWKQEVDPSVSYSIANPSAGGCEVTAPVREGGALTQETQLLPSGWCCPSIAGACPASCIFGVVGFRTLLKLSVRLLRVLLLQNSANMPEVRELSEALSEMSMDPITGVGVVASRNRAPTGYDVVRSGPAVQSPWKQPDTEVFPLFQVSTTTDGLDADLWKDGLFKSKVTRYLCFTRVFSKENVSWGSAGIWTFNGIASSSCADR